MLYVSARSANLFKQILKKDIYTVHCGPYHVHVLVTYMCSVSMIYAKLVARILGVFLLLLICSRLHPVSSPTES